MKQKVEQHIFDELSKYSEDQIYMMSQFFIKPSPKSHPKDTSILGYELYFLWLWAVKGRSFPKIAKEYNRSTTRVTNMAYKALRLIYARKSLVLNQPSIKEALNVFTDSHIEKIKKEEKKQTQEKLEKINQQIETRNRIIERENIWLQELIKERADLMGAM